MSQVGLDWYKREPVAYLGDVQGLTSKEHAVYSIIIDLLYVHGGVIQNDPKFIAGYISDMGAASVRGAVKALASNPRITLEISGEEISQKRAKNEVKTKVKLRENAQKSGGKGGKRSAELRRQFSDNNNLAIANPSNENQAEKIREEKRIKRTTKVVPKKPPLKDVLIGLLCEVSSKQMAQDFIEHRQAIKKPMTELAAKMIANKLRGNMNADAVLSLSIENGWPGVYPESSQLNGGHNGKRNYNTEGGQRPDPAIANIARLAGLNQAPGDGGG